MKKVIALLSCMLILVSCVALAGCGKQDLTNSKYLGTWVATKAEMLGEESGLDEAIPGGMTFKLNPDGTAIVTSAEEVSNCTWSETSKGIKFKGELTASAKAEGDELVMKVVGLSLHFTKQSQAAEAVSEIGGAISDAVSDVIDNAVSGAAEIVDNATTTDGQ